MDIINVILIEDNEGDIHLIREALEDNPIVGDVIIYKNGKDALEFLENCSNDIYKIPYLILLDINLPIISGKDVLDRVKENSITSHIPVIILTTSSSPKDIQDCYMKQANCYVVKPIDVDIYYKAVNHIVNYYSAIIGPV